MSPERVVLMVDDSPDDQMLVVRAVKRQNLEVRVVLASGGREALRFLETDGALSGHPILILLDLRMPDMDGLETLQQLKGSARGRTVPVVVFTSSAERKDIERCYAMGASSYVRKPVDGHQFQETVRRVLEYWMGLNEPPVATTTHGVVPRFRY